MYKSPLLHYRLKFIQSCKQRQTLYGNRATKSTASSFVVLPLFPHRPLCVVGRLGRKKKRARGAWWKGEREEERQAPAFSLFPWFPVRFLFFDYCYFYWDTQRKPLRRRQLFCNKLGERQRARFPYCPLAKFWTNVILASHADVFREARFSSLPTEGMKKELP